MSLRIVREKIYVPLPIGIDKVLRFYGGQSVAIPLNGVCMSEDDLLPLRHGAMLRGLVVVENDLPLSRLEAVVEEFNARHGGMDVLTVEMAKCLDKCALLSVRYKVRMDGRECWIDMDKFEYLDFVLCWHKGMFLPSGKQHRLDAVKTLLLATGIVMHHDAKGKMA